MYVLIIFIFIFLSLALSLVNINKYLALGITRGIWSDLLKFTSSQQFFTLSTYASHVFLFKLFWRLYKFVLCCLKRKVCKSADISPLTTCKSLIASSIPFHDPKYARRHLSVSHFVCNRILRIVNKLNLSLLSTKLLPQLFMKYYSKYYLL